MLADWFASCPLLRNIAAVHLAVCMIFTMRLEQCTQEHKKSTNITRMYLCVTVVALSRIFIYMVDIRLYECWKIPFSTWVYFFFYSRQHIIIFNFFYYFFLLTSLQIIDFSASYDLKLDFWRCLTTKYLNCSMLEARMHAIEGFSARLWSANNCN